MNKQTIFIVIFLIILVAVVVAWVVFFRGEKIKIQTQTNPNGETGQTGGLGEEIYKKSANPLEGKIQTTNPAGNANPLEGVYKNPFGG